MNNKKISVGYIQKQIVYHSNQIIEKYKDKLNIICANKKDIVKCLKQNKIHMYQAQITFLKQNMNKCNQTTNPQKCRDLITSKIIKIIKKINELKTK